MMRKYEDDWSVSSWFRYDAEPPMQARERGPDVTVDGIEFETWPKPDPEWERAHRRLGAAIHDHARSITYEATLDRATGEIEHLKVEVNGYVGTETSVPLPLARIRHVVAEQVLAVERAREEHGESVLVFTPTGGVEIPDDEGRARRGTPTPDEFSAYLAEHPGLTRQQIADDYGRKVSTVDRWLWSGRRDRPDLTWPERVGGRRIDLEK